MTSIMTALSLQLKVMKMASVSTVTLVLLGFIASSKGSLLEKFAATGGTVTFPLEHKLQSGEKVKWKNDLSIISNTNEAGKDSKKAEVLKNGSLILKYVTKEDEGKYTPEVFDRNGKNVGPFKSIRLIVMDPVKTPNLTVNCKNGKVSFTCTPDKKDKDPMIKWFENNKELLKQNGKKLEKNSSDVKTKNIFCQVSNKVSSMKSKPLEKDCSDSTISDVFTKYIWYFVGGGAGLVLLLTVLILICFIQNRRRRHMRMRDEMEFRLNYTNAEHHQQHPPHQQQHPPLPRERQQNQPRQQPAGHTGPRQNCSRHQRQRASEPSNNHPQPSPRRATQAPKAANQNDDEVPPPLPQPRKKGPRT